jgi:hypothetical protein
MKDSNPMTEADSAHSAPPPLNSCSIQALTTRRTILARLAVLPIAVPAAATEPDPIFAAIDACRSAKQTSDEAYARVRKLRAWTKRRFGTGDEQRQAREALIERALGCDEDTYTDNPAAALWDAYEAFAETVPTTLAGLFAMLAFADEVADREREFFNDTAIFSTFAAAAAALTGGRQ